MPILGIYDSENAYQEIEVLQGANLREVLLAAGISPYGRFSKNANCGGWGICATCGVWIADGEPEPAHWHDRAAARFGYPRLSCQINIEANMVIHLVENKLMWGPRQAARRRA